MGDLVDVAEVCIIYFHMKFVSKHISKYILFPTAMQLYKLSM